MKLSIFLAGIRTENWLALYNSVGGATTNEFEMIFVSPYDLPDNMKGFDNVRLVKDRGCPSRCYQLGLIESKGEFVVWGADDGTFNANLCIDKAMKKIQDYKDVVAFKYFEGKPTRKSQKQSKRDWWYIGRHKLLKSCAYAPDHYVLVMNALMHREYLIEMGGWDCRFEHLGLGSVDLGIRLQNNGANVLLGKKFMTISHLPGTEGDHAPIYYSHIENDEPLFKSIYRDESALKRSVINIDNWRNAEDVWSRRFKDGK